MKLLHISDLHIGKRLGEMPLTEDQKYILDRILEIADEEKPDAVLIAGDVYDKSVPPAEAVSIFDDFIVSLSGICPRVFIISGNHDNGTRLAFGNRLMKESGVVISSVFDGALQEHEMEDEFGTVRIWLLPFIKPVHVRRAEERAAAEPGSEADSEAIDDYTSALRRVIGKASFDPAERHVLAAHQYVTGGIRSDSEEKNLGGLDNVDAEVFAPFDYVALGHLHRAQTAGGEQIRYSGAPLCYSFAEAEDDKQALIVELKEKGSLEVRPIPLKPLRAMRTIRGTFDELMSRSFYEGTDYQEAFVRAVLTDEEYIPEGIRRLRTVYRNILEVSYEKAPGAAAEDLEAAGRAEHLSPGAYLAEFYRAMRGRDMNEDQAAFAEEMISEIWEEDE